MATVKVTLRIVFLLALFPPPFASAQEARSLTYVAEGKRESVRLYGNINKYAYWFVDLLVGTPPQRTSAIIDTGSTVCAFSCDICAECGVHIDSAFSVSNSSSASWTSCSADCPAGLCRDGRCAYSISYLEGSSISGYWFNDVVQLGDQSEGNLPVMSSLGCHTAETKLFYTQSVNGILGLAPTVKGMFPSILGSLFSDSRINKSLFSICLSPDGGELVVGGFETAFSGDNQMRWIPLTIDTFYSVPLSKIRVENVAGSGSFGRTIVDSGTTLVYFPGDIFKQLFQGIDRAASKAKIAKQGDRCYASSERSVFPPIHFDFNGISIAWSPEEYLFFSKKGSICVAFEELKRPGETVLGASFFINKNIVFDLTKSRLGIAKAQCPSYSDRPPAHQLPYPTQDVNNTTTGGVLKSQDAVAVMQSSGESAANGVDPQFFVWPLVIGVSIGAFIYWRNRRSSRSDFEVLEPEKFHLQQ